MDDFILVKTFTNRLEADVFKAILETEGIEALIRGDDAGGMLPNLSFTDGVFLYVPKSQFDKAQEVLHSKSK